MMRAIAGKEWGAERDSMLRIYQALIRSTIDYGCMIYGSASESLLRSLDRIQYRALRICLGATKTTPVNALLVEANEMPLRLRRVKLSLVFWTSLKSYTGERIAKDVLNNCWKYLNSKGRGYGWKINQLAEKNQIANIECSVSPVWGEVLIWIIPEIKIDLEILDKKREWEEMGMVKYHVHKYIQERLYASMHIYTDGSKDTRTGITGIGVYIPEFKISISKRLTSKLSILLKWSLL